MIHKCKLGIHTETVELLFSEEEYEYIKRALPAPIGKRSWYVEHTATQVIMRRSQFGTSPHWDKSRAMHRVANDMPTIARHRTTDFPFYITVENQLVVNLPPVHEWPWIHDGGSKLKKMTKATYRERLIQELNARAKSATLAQVDTLAIPDWAHKMLTDRERLLYAAGEEI